MHVGGIKLTCGELKSSDDTLFSAQNRSLARVESVALFKELARRARVTASATSLCSLVPRAPALF